MKAKKNKSIKESMGMEDNDEDHVMQDHLKVPGQDNILQIQVLEVYKFEVGSSLAHEALLTEAMWNN